MRAIQKEKEIDMKNRGDIFTLTDILQRQEGDETQYMGGGRVTETEACAGPALGGQVALAVGRPRDQSSCQLR